MLTPGVPKVQEQQKKQWQQPGSFSYPAGAAVYDNLFMVYSYVQGEYLMAKMTTRYDVVDDDVSHVVTPL
jgi:hypothetical protein